MPHDPVNKSDQRGYRFDEPREGAGFLPEGGPRKMARGANSARSETERAGWCVEPRVPSKVKAG